ncbi:LamG domain-containing protein [Actinoallomurus purpureus]|uniref:LamG domain-containing protein n=1 Tax=Actinoallomurus purpureus TaxID=478114 RepID=UPI002091FE3D|nr:LamG domain-containing protein [Actinoallomurus purpureus]MCO6003555.1 LamG domain-containing protein [Actinoallomurus purpureus]
MSAALVLHWPLDALTPESRALDTSANRLNGDVEGDPTNVPDPKFGSCLRFATANDRVDLADAPQLRVTAYTVELWVNPASTPRPVGLLGKGADLGLVLAADGSLTHRFATSADPSDAHGTGPNALPAGTWRHVAITNDGQTARIYLDGVQAAEYAFSGGRTPDQSALVVAASAPGVFAGRMAHLRIYDDALSPVEIARDMADDQAALDSFVRTHPLDFEFVNVDDQPVLFIDDGPGGQPMTLRFTNTSRTAITVLPLAGLSASTYHFALRFRTGTLPIGLVLQTAEAGWELLPAADGTALYLLWKTPAPIAPGASVSLRIDGFNADGATGTHGTRVELDYQKLQYADENAELTGARMQFLDVVNHRGRRDIPLDLRLVGGDRVLSDGHTASSLRMHLTNVLRDGPGITLRAATPASSFVVSFDVQEENEDRPWALTDAGEASAVVLKVTQPGWNVVSQSLGQRVQWTLTPTADTVLGPDRFLEVTLDEVFGLPTPGQAPIAVDYQNIPGYSDGTLTVSAERTPLLYTDAYVGVNTTTPEARLQVVDVNQDANGGALVLGPKAQSNLRLGYHQDYSWIQSHGGKPLLINSIGNNVGINSTATGYGTLTVGGTGAPVNAGASHVQLRRETAAGAVGKVMYLELYQDATSGPAYTFPSIRFHHSQKYWHRIEARPEGFLFKTGDLGSDVVVDVYAGTAVVTALKIGNTVIGEGELKILRKLVLGQLQFDLYNVAHDEYAYGADISYDGSRGYVFTNRNKGRVPYGRWRIDFPS